MERSRYNNENYFIGSKDCCGVYNTLLPALTYNNSTQQLSIDCFKQVQCELFLLHESLWVIISHIRQSPIIFQSYCLLQIEGEDQINKYKSEEAYKILTDSIKDETYNSMLYTSTRQNPKPPQYTKFNIAILDQTNRNKFVIRVTPQFFKSFLSIIHSAQLFLRKTPHHI